MGLAGIPQVLDIWNTRSSEGINPTFIIMIVLGLSGFLLNGYVIKKETGSWNTFISQIPNWIIMTILLVSIYIFR